MPVALEYYSDHLIVRMVGPAALASLRRTVVIPYSAVRDVAVGVPRHPPLWWFRVGTHWPNLYASGIFVKLPSGPRRFVHYERATTRALTIHLDGHTGFDEVSVDVADPDAAALEIKRRRDEAPRK